MMDPKARVRQQFGPASAAYAASEVHARGESLSLLLELVQPQRGWEMLDVATGAGHTALAFAPFVRRVVAADWTPQMLDQTKALAQTRGVGNLEIALADAEQLPFEDRSFDLVTCRLALHHFPRPARAVAEFVRTLRPGGVLGFTDNITVENPAAAQFYNDFERLRDPSHQWVFSPSALRQLIEAEGLRVETERVLHKEFEFQEWADRQRVTEPDKQRLMEMMRALPEPLEPHFLPRWQEGTLYFTLWESVLVAHKPA